MAMKALLGLIIFAALAIGGGYAIYGMLDDQNASEAAANAVVMPYVMANIAGEHAAAREAYTSDEWKARHSADDLAATYRGAREQHGEISRFELWKASGVYADGEDRIRASVRVHMQDGVLYLVIFMLKPDAASGSHRIVTSWASGPVTPEGPW